MSENNLVLKGVIIKKLEKLGETNGKKWVNFSFIIKGEDKKETWCSTLNSQVAENLHEEDYVELEVKQAGKFLNIDKIIKAEYDEKKAKETKLTPKEFLDKDNYWKNKELRELENNPKIIRQSCLKAAATLYSGLGSGDIDSKFLIEESKKLEKYVNGVE